MQEQNSEISALESQNGIAENNIYHLNKLFKIMANYHHRTFINCFKWHVFQSLLKNMSSHQNKPKAQPQQWLYQSLLQKKNKSQQEMIELEFVNMCASKIQNAFKAYIHTKRHRQAMRRLQKFKDTAQAVVKGWKTRQIFRIVKIQESFKTIRAQKEQLSKERTITQQTNNKYSIRKLEYLKNSLQDHVSKFSSKFQYLYSTGEWVFQPKVPKKHQLHTTKWNKKQRPIHQESQRQVQQQTFQNPPLEEQHILQSEQVPKKKRVRQMRDRNTRVSKPQQNKLKQQAQTKQATQYTKATQDSNVQSNFQAGERPIKAKGVYHFDDLPIQSPQEPPKSKKNEVLTQKRQDNTEKNEEKDGNEVNSKKAAERQKNKTKMQTRQKYDPRKAIQQEKRKKKEQQLTKNEVQPHQIQQKPASQTNIPVRKQTMSKSNEKGVVESKSQNTLKISEKQQVSNRSTVNMGKGKSKVEAKIDCWGNRKTNKSNIKNENNRMTYKMIHNAQQAQEKTEQAEKHHEIAKNLSLLNKIKEQKLKEKSYSQKQAQFNQMQARSQLEKIPQKIAQFRRQQDNLNTQQAYINQNKKLNSPLRQKMRRAEQMRQKEAHKQIYELQKVYSQQYQSRFQKLLPKLHLLAAARQQESEGPIPVLLGNGSFMRRKIGENLVNNRFWMIGKKIENSFKQFDKTI